MVFSPRSQSSQRKTKYIFLFSLRALRPSRDNNSGDDELDVYKQIFINGTVQGVFFRDSTRQKANELNLNGGVRNLFDGRVEALVSGEETAVQTLIKWLEIGPKYAKVSTIEVIDLPITDLSDKHSGRFEIWPSK